MKKIFHTIITTGSIVFGPMIALAQSQFGGSNIGSGQTATGVLNIVANILNVLIPILITLGVIYLIWGVITYITAKDEEKKKEARGVMISGAIGLFFILAIWGIIGLISSTLGVGVGGTLQSNQIPGVSN